MNALTEKVENGKLKIVDTKLYPSRMDRIVKLLRDDSNLTSLELSYCTMDLPEMQKLMNALAGNSTVKTLRLYDCDIWPKETTLLSDMLKRNSTLLTLVVCYNHIGNIGVRYLADALSYNCTITSVTFYSNNIGVDGKRYLLQSLRMNASILKYFGDLPQIQTILIRNSRGLKATRAAALCLMIIQRRDESSWLKHIGKDVTRLIAKMVWQTRGQREWLCAVKE